MLTKSVLKSIQEAAGLATFSPPVSVVSKVVSTRVPKAELKVADAANANRFDQHAALVRRNRRIRRAERTASRSLGGWTARMW